MQTISKAAIDRMIGNQRLIGLLMAFFNKSSFAINRWIQAKDVRLTVPGALEIIRDETGLSYEELLEKEAATAA